MSYFKFIQTSVGHTGAMSNLLLLVKNFQSQHLNVNLEEVIIIDDIDQKVWTYNMG